ncbi:hypothetical protein HELRODRAFT_180047 [Helobdella robusta]|uniref:BACK domain-containing protein n=1 Tax=Helobdella robusta TaxID=6412 RepID=T1FFE2_HELRO|nr:hypothetical protein HELRODRAFT_180047 [Helobdella robusta]ESN94940.1 hypothetical protein HELRODRAFT_180047 [Helobdella robusta]
METGMNKMGKGEAADHLQTIVFISKTGGRFDVSRVSLIETSDYYQALVNSGMRDAHFSELAFECLSDLCLQEIKEFLLISRCSEKENKMRTKKMKRLKNIERGFDGASYLQINDMMTLYLKHLLRHLNDSSYARLKKFAKKYTLVEVVDKIHEFVLKNFKKIAKRPEILLYDILLHLVKSDLVNAESEFDIFKLIADWISAKESRRPYAENVFREVRFNLMSTEEKQKCVDVLKKMELNVSKTGKNSNRYRSVGKPHWDIQKTLVADLRNSDAGVGQDDLENCLTTGGNLFTKKSTTRKREFSKK